MASALPFGCVLADVFPNADASGELSSAAAWGDPAWFSKVSPYGSAQHDLELNTNGTFSITGDVTFAKLVNSVPKNKKATIDCTRGSSRPKVSLTGLAGNSTANIHNTTFELIGGDWDLGGGDVEYGTYYASNRKIVLSDNAVVTNVGALNLAKTTLYNNEVVLGGASELYVTKGVSLAAQKAGSFIRVTDGSTFFHLGGDKQYFNTGVPKSGATYESDRSGIIVSNSGSRAYLAMGESSLVLLGNGPAGGFMHVTDHAFAKVGNTLRVGNTAKTAAAGAVGSNTIIRVENGGCLCTDLVYFPYGPTYGNIAGGNRFEVLADGVYTNSGSTAFYLQEKGNMIVVSNGVAAIGNLSVTGSDNEVVLRGSKPRLICTAGNGHGLEVAGGNRICFELVPSGYDADVVPIESDKNIVLNEGVSFRFTGLESVLAQMARDGVRKRTMTLMKGSGKRSITGAEPIIAAIEESHALPEGCTLSLVSNELILTCKVRQGLVVTIR